MKLIILKEMKFFAGYLLSKKLLKITSKLINTIAIECGFNSASNFIREFKNKTNITPKQYRKLYLATKVK